MRGLGLRPDPSGHKRTPFLWLARRLGLSSSSLPTSASLAEYMPAVLDQGSTSSCTGHSTAAALYATLAAAGTPLDWVPSPKGIYTLGRAIDRASTSDGLQDSGAQPNQVFRAIDEFGVHAMKPLPNRFSDCDPATIDDEPNLAEIEEDAVTVVSGDYGITDVGTDRETAICMALAAKRAVCVSIAGGSAMFQSFAGGVMGPIGTDLDHYVMIHGFATNADGSRVYTLRNSWGIGWGEGGDFRLNSAAVAELGDLVVCDATIGGA